MTDGVECRTPTPGIKPVAIDRAKFDTFRKAILKVLPETGGVPFADLPELVAPPVPAGIGSIPSCTTTVKLELEVRGEISRMLGVTPQYLLRK